MIARILASSSNFHGVKYNEKNIKNKGGELLQIKNMPFNKNDAKMNDIKDYLKSISDAKMRNKSTFKNLQFHATISCKGTEKNKEELKEIGEKWMEKMGYGNQPYISVFHGNTKNNHIHLVSTRVDLETGKKIKDSNEGRKALNAINKICTLEKKRKDIIDDKHLNRFLKSYKYDSFVSLKNFLNSKNYKVYTDENKNIRTSKNEKEQTTDRGEMVINNRISHEEKKRLQALLYKSLKNSDKKLYGKINKSNKKLYDIKSELTKELKQKFGIEICPVISKGNVKNYTLIDHNKKSVYNGNSIMHSRNLFSSDIKIIGNERIAKANSFHPNSKSKIDFLSKYFDIPDNELTPSFGKSDHIEQLKDIYKQEHDIEKFLSQTETKIFTNDSNETFIFNIEKGILENTMDVFGEEQRKVNREEILYDKDVNLEPQIGGLLKTISGNSEFGDQDEEENRKRRKKRKR